jgi:flagellar basal-body rod modification protein FlgD
MVVIPPNDTSPKQDVEDKSTLKDDFLKLFITQLKYQDPLNPLDGKDMTAQLAQFSSLEQLNNIKMQLQDLLLFQNSLQNTLTVNLIGKKVEVVGNKISLDGTSEIHFTLPMSAKSVKISIYDSTGALVRNIDLGPRPAGDNTYTWDGLDNSGIPLPSGQYEVSIEAYDESGNPMDAESLTYGTVTGITFEDNITYLILDNGVKIQLNEIKTIGGV